MYRSNLQAPEIESALRERQRLRALDGHAHRAGLEHLEVWGASEQRREAPTHGELLGAIKVAEAIEGMSA